MTLSINDWAEEVHRLASEKGFWDDASDDPRFAASLLALIHTEVSEAVEALRRNNRENFGEELADVIIRTLDLAAGCDIDIEQAMLEKHAINKTRERKHGRLF